MIFIIEHIHQIRIKWMDILKESTKYATWVQEKIQSQLKAWPNAFNISMQHLTTLLHDVATCVEWAGQTHTKVSTFSMRPVDVYVP